MSEFKDMLTYLRKRENLSQRELAAKLHVSASTIGMYESGKRFPSREQEEEIADFFNVNISTLRGKPETEELSSDLAKKLIVLRKETDYIDDLVAFTKLSPSDKQAIVNMIRRLSIH